MRFKIAFVAIAIVTLCGVASFLEWQLRGQGWGEPPLYSYDSASGYVLKPSQNLLRSGQCRVMINGLGMRSKETSLAKQPGTLRVLVVGDSVPFGGSYIDQDDTFCNVAEKILNARRMNCEVLNAGVNAYGPQNVLGYLQSRGSFGADLMIVYFPWGNLRRDFTNFYIVPFWSNSPGWAVAEFFRHMVWAAFGALSNRWKDINAFDNDSVLASNLGALAGIKKYCDAKAVPVFFLWSPYREVVMGTGRDIFLSDRARLYQDIPAECIVDLTPAFMAAKDIPPLYVDPVHYSREGHLLAGKFVADFIRKTLPITK